MSSQFSTQDLKKIDSGIRDKYVKVAQTPEGHFKYPTGRNGLKGLGYPEQLMADLPDPVADSFCGVGNPFSLGEIASGGRVLDVGCGAGVDALLAAKLVGDSGNVLGIDLTEDMIQKAVSNKEMMNCGNINFRVSRVQNLVGNEADFDVVLSNGVFNLIPEKEVALRAVYRLLKPGGSLLMADQFVSGVSPKEQKDRVATWFQ